MSDPRICDNKDLVELCPAQDLWLKPHAKITVTVTLPTMKTMDNSGQLMTISTWEVMDKLKKRVRPLKFKTIKVSQSNIEFIRFEAECQSQTDLGLIEPRLNKTYLKLSGFAQTLMVKTARVKIGSTRHEWESYFRDRRNMDEMKPGCRPDTIHLESLPVKWFGGEKPSPNLLVKVFGTFGQIRRFHIPCLDIKEDKEEGFKRFTFNESLSFDAYIQYKDYIGFVKAMNALRGMKLVKKLSEVKSSKNFLEYDIKIDFDKTKHLCDKAVKKRRIAREYGITSAVELKKFRDEAKKQRQMYENRVETLRKRKESAKKSADRKAKARKQLEEQKRAEEKIKERLLLEEVKLREKLLEKLLEKKREMLLEKRREMLLQELRVIQGDQEDNEEGGQSEAQPEDKDSVNDDNSDTMSHKSDGDDDNDNDMSDDEIKSEKSASDARQPSGSTSGRTSVSTCPSPVANSSPNLDSNQKATNEPNVRHKSVNTNLSSFNSYPFHPRKYPNHYLNNKYINYRRFLYLNHQRRPLHQTTASTPYRPSLYKHHKKGCKFYRPKSIVVKTNSDSNKTKL